MVIEATVSKLKNACPHCNAQPEKPCIENDKPLYYLSPQFKVKIHEERAL